jgi:hypothetical protein
MLFPSWFAGKSASASRQQGSSKRADRPTAKKKRRRSFQIESLEPRLALSASPLSLFQPAVAPTTPSASTTSLYALPGTSLSGSQVTLEAFVNHSPGAGFGGFLGSLFNSNTPTGTVTFEDGTTVLGTGTVNQFGLAILQTSTLALGTHSITAIYGGDTNDLGSTSKAITETVVAQGSTTTYLYGPSTASAGQNVTYNVYIGSNIGGIAGSSVGGGVQGNPAPTGTVTFEDGTTVLGTATVTNSFASFKTTSLTVGAHSITAIYSGDTDYLTSTSTAVSTTINQARTSTTLQAAPGTALVGAPVTFTANVNGPTGTGITPTGNITFMDGTTVLATLPVAAPAAGTTGVVATASFTTSSLTAGVHSITAVYSGDSTFLTSTSKSYGEDVVTQLGLSTTIKLTGPTTIAYGQLANLTVVVAGTPPSAAVPTGTVTFMDGTTTIGTATLKNGAATLSLSTLAIGTHSITAVYGGDSIYTTNTSTAVSETVKQGVTHTTVTASPYAAVAGQNVSFTATVFPAGGLETGTVTFKDGSTVLGTVPLAAGGTATYSTTSLAVGTHAITAVYSGDTNFAGSTSSGYFAYIAPDAFGTVQGSGTLKSGADTFTSSVTDSLDSSGNVTYGGSFTYTDSGKSVSLASTSITALRVDSSGKSASFSGTATVNGATGYTFYVFIGSTTAKGSSTAKQTMTIEIVGPKNFSYFMSAPVDTGGTLTLTSTSTGGPTVNNTANDLGLLSLLGALPGARW